MSGKRIAVVGGGVGGITAALMLAADGHRVTLFERSSRVGGRLRFQRMGPYRIDQGPTIVLLPDMLLGHLKRAGVDLSRLNLTRCDPMYRIHYADGSTLNKWSEPERMMRELAEGFPGEEAGFARYMRDLAAGFRQGSEAFLARSFHRKREFFTPRNLGLLTKLQAYRTVRGQASSYFKDPRLVDAFSLQSLYIGGAPHRTPALYSLIPYAEHAFGVWYLQGGYAALAALLEETLREKGVELRLSTAVTGLPVEEGRCIGVTIEEPIAATATATAMATASATARTERYDAVVYNGEAPYLPGLLQGNGERDRRLPQAKAYKPSSGCILVYLGVKKQWEEATTHQFFLPPSLTRSLRQIFDENRLAEEPSFYVFNPSAIDETAAPPGESVLYFLIPAPPAASPVWAPGCEVRVERLVERVLEEAERRGFPGLREAITAREVRTPVDAEAAGLYGGGSFGIAPTLTQSGVFRPQAKPFYNIDRLYAVGASVHPGGGVPIVMQGAELAADQIRREEQQWRAYMD